MKRILAFILAMMMLMSCTALSEDGTNDAGSKIAGAIEEGAYILSVKTGPEDAGEWRADEMAQDDSVVKLAASGTENGVFTARYEPTGDGDVSVSVRHFNAHHTCDEMHSFDLRVRDGKVQEVTGGSYTVSPAEEELDAYFSGEWTEKDTQFTSLDVTKNDDGWKIEIMSPVSHGAWLIRATVYHDCDYNALVYSDGVKYDLMPENETTEAATGLWGTLKFTGTADQIQLEWYDQEMAESLGTVTFERATEAPKAEMTAEELYRAGKEAHDAGDYGKAMEYYQLAAEAGNAEGWRSIGAMYGNGEGVGIDYERAREYFQLAADQGNPKSVYNLGMLYQFGLGVDKDIGKAVEYYEKSGELGYSDAYAELGSLYLYGEGVEQDNDKATEYFQKAADLGDISVWYTLGVMYYRGEGVEQDYSKAAEYYQKAAELGVVQVLGELGMMYYTGEGVEQDYGTAAHYFAQAAEQEEPAAMFTLGECLRLGQGLEKDAGKAAEWYRKALEHGYDPDEEEKEMLKAVLGEEYTVFFPAPEEGKDYTVRTAGILTGEEQTGSMDLRFYLSAPHVPYYGMKAYVNFMYQTGLMVTPPEEDGGVWEVSNPNGTKILVNPSAGTIEAADWARFQIPPLPYTTLVGIKDSTGPWTWYSEEAYDDPPAPVTFDFAKYGIPVYADGEDVYLPLELLSTMFTDAACNYVLWNGESVLKQETDIDKLGFMPFEWYEGEYMRSLLTGNRKRAEDVIREDYAELCFTMDYFYGHPGVVPLDRGIREKGFEAALDDIPELVSIKDRLKDPDMVEYMLGLYDLFNIGLNEGHSSYYGINAMELPDFPYPETVARVRPRMNSMHQALSYARLENQAEITKARKAAWGDEVYRECGNTAILRIDEFIEDEAGWEAYYAGKGEIPMDAVGITWTGLKRASENPAIRNILFDLSANSGGSSDMLAYMMDLMFGENVFRGYNVLTGQREHAVVHSDKNLDGVFDEKDEEVKYDFNYAVLTTRISFSCGNLMPFLMQEHGAVLLGEPSGGGSCIIQMGTLTNGGQFQISSWLWALRDANGESMEGGCKTDLPIARIEPETPTHENPMYSRGDYTPYFDDVKLDRMINEWFEEQALAPAA